MRLFQLCCLLFLFLNTSESVQNKTCYTIGKTELFCLQKHESGLLKAIEFSYQYSMVPSSALYFYPEGSLMTFFDRREKNYFYFTKKQHLQEMLTAENYRYFHNNDLQVECVGEDCIHYQYEFSNVPDNILQVGDVVFSGNINYYSGSARAVFTHVDIICDIKDGKPWSISADIMSKLETQPLSESISNTLNWLVLRHNSFQEEFLEFWQGIVENEEKNLAKLPPQVFCTDLFAKLYQKIKPETFQNMDYFSTAFPESLANLALQDFQVVGSHFAEFKNPQEFQQKRQTRLQELKTHWEITVSDPQNFLYHDFLLRLPFLPIIHEEEKIQLLIQYFGQGLWQSGATINTAGTTSTTGTTGTTGAAIPERSCFKTANGSICFERFANGQLKLLEEYDANKSKTPLLAFYFYPNGQPMIYMDWRRKKYLAFDTEGHLTEKMLNERYTYFENQKVVLSCVAEKCESQKYSLTMPEAQNMQVGDIIFTGNLYPHNGHLRSPLTHVAFFAGHQNEQPVVLTNDVFETPQILDFSTAFPNTVNYIVIRNPEFSHIFRQYLADFLAQKTLRNPAVAHFCGNILVSLMKRLYPDITQKWDNMDKNHLELIFCNIYPLFATIDYHLLTHKTPSDLQEKICAKNIKIKLDIAFIMENPHNFLYALFARNFSLLPVCFERDKIEQVLFFMYYHYPLE